MSGQYASIQVSHVPCTSVVQQTLLCRYFYSLIYSMCRVGYSWVFRLLVFVLANAVLCCTLLLYCEQIYRLRVVHTNDQP